MAGTSRSRDDEKGALVSEGFSQGRPPALHANETGSPGIVAIAALGSAALVLCVLLGLIFLGTSLLLALTILAALVGSGFLILAAYEVRDTFAEAYARKHRNDWIKEPVDDQVVARLAQATEVIPRKAPAVATATLVLSPSSQIASVLRERLTVLKVNTILSHDIMLASDWIVENSDFFEYVVLDVDGFGVTGSVMFVDDLVSITPDLPVVALSTTARKAVLAPLAGFRQVEVLRSLTPTGDDIALAVLRARQRMNAASLGGDGQVPAINGGWTPRIIAGGLDHAD